VWNEIRWDVRQQSERGYQGDVYGTNDISHRHSIKVFLAECISQLHRLIDSRNNALISMQWTSEAV
jgi:hypothetical protein